MDKINRTPDLEPSKPIQKEEIGPKDLSDIVRRPDSKSLHDRMKRVDPSQARRYRQRSGE